MANAFAELMQDLGIKVAGVFNPQPPTLADVAPAPGPYPGAPPPELGPGMNPGVQFPPNMPRFTGPAQPRVIGQEPTMTLESEAPPVPPPPEPPGGQIRQQTQPQAQPRSGRSGDVLPADRRGVGSMIGELADALGLTKGLDVRESSVNPMNPPQAGSGPLPVDPEATMRMARDLGIDVQAQRQPLSIPGTAIDDGQRPAPPGERRWTSAGTSRGIIGPQGAPRPAASGGPNGGVGGMPVASSSAPAPPSSPAASVSPTTAPATAAAAGGDRFGISPRTYQLLGVIGATLMMGPRPGENAAATVGRAMGAGIMYDNFARLSDVEQQASERNLSIKEKQLGLQGQQVGQAGRLGEARIAAIKADIENDKARLGLAQSKEERDAIMDRIRTQSALIGLAFQPDLLQAELRTKQAGVETPEMKRGRLMLDLMKESKNLDGTTNFPEVMRKMRLTPGLGFKQQTPQVLAEGRARLSAIKDPAQQAQMREQMNMHLMSKGFLPEL